MSYRIVTTWPEADLLPELRAALDQADEALLLCRVRESQGHQPGGAPATPTREAGPVGADNDFQRLVASPGQGGRVRRACARAQSRGGTYHPKMYLTASGATAQVLIGSANLTSGLVCNIEVGTVLTAARSDPPLVRAWDLGERLWVHPTAVDWKPGLATSAESEPLASALSQSLAAALPVGSTVMTLARGRPNIIRAVAPEGVYIETVESIRKGQARPARAVLDD